MWVWLMDFSKHDLVHHDFILVEWILDFEEEMELIVDQLFKVEHC
jgi:hypothetical protein